MAVSASPLPESLPVEPGAEVSCRVTVRNDSKIVDEYGLELLGSAAEWATVEPPTLSLMPGTEGEVTLTFRPPRASSLAPGALPFGFKVTSLERPETSAVVEGALDVQPFADFSAELFPRTSRGSLGGKHELAFDNRGNRRVQARLSAIDPDDVLRFSFNPPVLEAPPGSASFSKVRVRHRRRFLRGPARLHPFTVVVEPEDGPPLSADGTAVQEAVVPTWALVTLLALVALALLWAFVLTPEIEDTARKAANAQIVKIIGGGTGTTSTTDTTGTPGETGTTETTGGTTTTPTTGDEGTVSGNPFSRRLQVSCSATCSDGYTVPAGKKLAVTDIVLGNPENTKGTLTVRGGGSVLFVENLDNFRDLDFHFGTPVIVPARQTVTLSVSCAGPCSAAGFFTGTLG